MRCPDLVGLRLFGNAAGNCLVLATRTLSWSLRVAGSCAELAAWRGRAEAAVSLGPIFPLKKEILNMNRAQLIEALAAANGLSKAATGKFLDSLVATVQTAVKKGDTVALVGFGTFKAVKRAARMGKNPSTGASLKIAAATVPKFTPGAKFKAAVDPKAAARKAAKAGAAPAAKPAAKAPAKASAKKSK